MTPGRTLVTVALVGSLLSACTGSTTTSAASTTPPSTATTSDAPTPSEPKTGTIVAEPVATDLDHPATFVFDDSGALFYGERLTGEIRRIDPTTGKDTSVFTVPHVVGDVANEQGLVGLALAPDFPHDPWLYAYATRMVDGVAHDQIMRLRVDGTRGSSMQLVLDVQVAGERHNGGRMLFGPDGMLYVVVGETYDSALAQDRSVNGGKVLRMTPTGGIPADNPFPGSRIYSYGNRNSFGLAFDQKTGDLWETENGPECNDELNRIQPGRNYGWGPSETCKGKAPRRHERRRPETGCTAAVLPDDDRTHRHRVLQRLRARHGARGRSVLRLVQHRRHPRGDARRRSHRCGARRHAVQPRQPRAVDRDGPRPRAVLQRRRGHLSAGARGLSDHPTGGAPDEPRARSIRRNATTATTMTIVEVTSISVPIALAAGVGAVRAAP